jgi:hypothetical protein
VKGWRKTANGKEPSDPRMHGEVPRHVTPSDESVRLGSRCRTRRNESKRRGLIAMEGRAGSSSSRARPEKISLSEDARFSGVSGSGRSSCWPDWRFP